MKTSIPFLFALLFTAFADAASAAPHYGTNSVGTSFLLPNRGTSAPATNTTPLPTSTATAGGYAVSVYPVETQVGGTSTVTWSNPDFPVINLLDRVALYRLVSTNLIFVDAKFIAGNRVESFTISTPGTYAVAYIKFPGTIVAWSSGITVRETGAPIGSPVLRAERGRNSMRLVWFAETNRTYHILFKHRMSDENWVDVTDIRGMGTSTNVLILNFGESGFYKLSVR